MQVYYYVGSCKKKKNNKMLLCSLNGINKVGAYLNFDNFKLFKIKIMLMTCKLTFKVNFNRLDNLAKCTGQILWQFPQKVLYL